MNVVLAFLIALWILCGYVFVRNYYVGKFRCKVINLCHEHNLRHLLSDDSAFGWFYDKVSYNKMLYSFKPLELEYWWTKEEIERLMS